MAVRMTSTGPSSEEGRPMFGEVKRAESRMRQADLISFPACESS